MEKWRRCPYCDEQIRKNAIKCKHCGSLLTDADIAQQQIKNPDTLIKQILGDKYELREIIGKGGMAVVYRAIQKNLDREVALKIIHQNLVHDKEFIERFLREARIGASLNHPNIVTIYDIGSLGPVHYMAMEFLKGETLREKIIKEEKLKTAKAIDYLAPIADALAYIHKKKLVHRDIKSSNVFITMDEKPVLTDFGIVFVRGQERLSTAGSVMGTPEYMSPEQAEGKVELDHRSDIYSFGTLLFESLTGQVPFHHENSLATINSLLNQPPPVPSKTNPDIPLWLSNLILACLEKDREFRLKDCSKIEKSLVTRQFYGNEETGIDATRKYSKGFSKEPIKPGDIRIPTSIFSKLKKINLIHVLLGLLIVILTIASYMYISQLKYNRKQAKNILNIINQQTELQHLDTAYNLCISGLEKYPQSRKLKIKTIEIKRLLEQQQSNRRQTIDKSDLTAQEQVSETTPYATTNGPDAATSNNADQDASQAPPSINNQPADVIDEQEIINTPPPPASLTSAQKRVLRNLGIELVQVNYSQGNFYIGKYEVTQAVWQRIMDNNPSIVNQNADYPVENVSPNQISQFIRRLNTRTGLTLRLPTEAEWEHAAAGGSSSGGFRYSGSNNIESIGWYEGNASDTYRKVGTRNPNQLGIYDMSGNVWEICSNNIIKGGSYMSPSNNCTISSRKIIGANDSDWSTGFRLCLSFE